MRTRIPGLIFAAAAVVLMGSCEDKQAPTGAASGSKTTAGGSQAAVVLTEANFQSEVLASTQPVLVDFWAAWCAPCRMVAPAVEEIAGEYAGRVKVGKVDVDSNGKLSKEYAIDAIPALLVYKNGKVVKKMVGVREKKEIAGALDEVLK